MRKAPLLPNPRIGASRSKQAHFVSLKLRLPPELHAQLKSATSPLSSLNSEIVRRLQTSFEQPQEATALTRLTELERDLQGSIQNMRKELTKRSNELDERFEKWVRMWRIDEESHD